MEDRNDRPLISTQHDTSDSHKSDKPGKGCSSTFWKLVFGILAISFVLNPFIKRDDSASSSTPVPSSQANIEKNTPSPNDEAQDAESLPPEANSQLSDLAQQYEVAFFHTLYTDMGTVSIYNFPERNELLENMVYWTTSDEGKASEINISLEHHLFGNDIWHITSNDSDYVYTGELKDGKPHGFGIIYDLSASQYDYNHTGELIALYYVGHFSEGILDGYGALFNELKDITYAARTINESGLISDEAGPAVLHYLFNHVSYEGYFQDNKINGKANHFRFPSYQGELFPFTLDVSAPIDGYVWANVYPYVTVGEYENGELNGNAILYRYNRLVYEGSVKKDKYDGSGTSYYNNGQIEYTGEWKNGKRHGFGTSYDENGTLIYAGNWENDDYAH